MTVSQLVNFFNSGSWSSQSTLNRYSKSLYVFAAINKIANKVSATELVLNEIKNSKGEVTEHHSHEALDLLYKVNPFQTRSEFWKTTIINKKLTGEAFWLKIRGARGKVIELWNLRPDLVEVKGSESNFISHYIFHKQNGQRVRIEAEDIIHFKEPDPTNAYRGMSPLLPIQSRIETEEFATKYQKNFFQNNARPDALLVTDDDLDSEQKSELVTGWNAKHKGTGKNSLTAILEGGLKYQQIAVTQREMDYIESMKFTRDDVLIAFGVPKSIITSDDVNRANAEAGMRNFLTETIKPEITSLVETINEMLIIPDFGDRLVLDFQDPTPEDREIKLKEYEAGFDKWLTRNEIRAELGREPINGGDDLTRPFSEVGISSKSQAGEKVFKGRSQVKTRLKLIEDITDELYEDVKKKSKNKEPMLTGQKNRQGYADLINKQIDGYSIGFQKLVEIEVNGQLKRILKKQKINNPNELIEFDFDKENTRFAALALTFLTDTALLSVAEAAELLGEDLELTSFIRKRLEKRATFFAETVNNNTFKKLSKTLAEGIESGEGIAELTKRVKSVYKEFPDYRAMRIARTEATFANNEGFLDAYRQSNIVHGKEWIATKDLRVRPEHLAMDGEIVSLNEVFSNGLMHPQEPNCRCVLSPSLITR